MSPKCEKSKALKGIKLLWRVEEAIILVSCVVLGYFPLVFCQASHQEGQSAKEDKEKVGGDGGCVCLYTMCTWFGYTWWWSQASHGFYGICYFSCLLWRIVRGEESWGGVVLWHWHQGGVSDNKSISRKDTLTDWAMCLKGNPHMMGEPDGETETRQRESPERWRFGDRAALAGKLVHPLVPVKGEQEGPKKEADASDWKIWL